MNEESLTVHDIVRHGPAIFEIRCLRGGVQFTPGDCVALYAEDGRVSRPYSIASGVDEKMLRFVIRQMPEGVVSGFLSSRKRGDIIRASPPFGWFRPGEHAGRRPFVFIATGTGVAPFLAHYRSRPSARPAASFYGVRVAEDLVDRDWLAKMGVTFAVSREDVPGCRHGRVTDLVVRMPMDAGTDYYLCGLDAMIDEVTVLLEDGGVPLTSVHRECFFNASYY